LGLIKALVLVFGVEVYDPTQKALSWYVFVLPLQKTKAFTSIWDRFGVKIKALVFHGKLGGYY